MRAPLLVAVFVLAIACGRIGVPADESCELGRDVAGGGHEAEAAERVPTPRKVAWEAERGGEVAARPHVTARLAGWPRSLEGAPLPADDTAFLRRVASDTWRGLTAFVDREHGLPVDHVTFGATVDRAAGRVGDYVNVTNVGLYLAAVAAASDLELTSRADAVARIQKVLATLEGLETHRGLLFNYYDTTSLERTSHFLSFVDTAWLVAGLMVVRQSFPELHAPATKWIVRADFTFFYDAERRRMVHGFWVQRGRRSRLHYGVLYAESRLGSLIAIGREQAPPEHWFGMVRTFPAACTWQRQVPQGRHAKEARGQAYHGGWYEWGGVRYVPSWGGSMFEALMPTVVLDEPRFAPASLGANDAAHVRVQQRVATEMLRLPVWGFSSSATLAAGGYAEHGVPDLGSIGYPTSLVTPHASALALAIDPAAATANLRTLAARYHAYGDFGFYDAVDPGSGAVAHVYLTLDQAMLFLATANRLCDGCVQRRFAADPIAARAIPILAEERFFD